jgi:hypothetical protein
VSAAAGIVVWLVEGELASVTSVDPFALLVGLDNN